MAPCRPCTGYDEGSPESSVPALHITATLAVRHDSQVEPGTPEASGAVYALEHRATMELVVLEPTDVAGDRRAPRHERPKPSPL